MLCTLPDQGSLSSTQMGPPARLAPRVTNRLICPIMQLNMMKLGQFTSA